MTIYGPDGSHHQDGMAVTDADWAAIDFVIWRCSIGSRVVDRTFARWRAAAQSHGKGFAAYHFVYRTVAGPTWRAHPAEAQADRVEEALDGDRTVPVMLDWESDGTQRPTIDDVALVAAALRARAFRVPLLYTGRWWWQEQGSPTLSGRGLELVNSNYGNQSPTGRYEIEPRYAELGGDTSRRWDANYGGLSPVIWQYGSRIRWGDRYMDMNAVRGRTIEECWQWFWLPTTTPSPKPPPTPPTPTPTPLPPTQLQGESSDMLLVLRYGGTAAAGWTGYVSLDCGFTSRSLNSAHHADLIMRHPNVVDAKTGAKVTTWSQVSWTSNPDELDEWLTPARD